MTQLMQKNYITRYMLSNETSTARHSNGTSLTSEFSNVAKQVRAWYVEAHCRAVHERKKFFWAIHATDVIQ